MLSWKFYLRTFVGEKRVNAFVEPDKIVLAKQDTMVAGVVPSSRHRVYKTAAGKA